MAKGKPVEIETRSSATRKEATALSQKGRVTH